MASFSNGQSEHPHSVDNDSSSYSDFEEQRFHANVHLSQRQHSAPTSASSSDSEQEEVSTRPAAEKSAAPPLPKNNPNSSDRSAVRNQSMPSDPNPNTCSASNPNFPTASSTDSEQEDLSTLPAAEKTLAPPSPKKNPKSSDRSAVRNQRTPSASNPNTRSASNPNIPSASKAKKGIAAKRAKDDVFAEEQPAPKKKMASKGKNVAQEEVPDSKPSRKRMQKQQLETSVPVPRVTRSAKHPQETYSKKSLRVWTKNEENVVMHCILNCAVEGVELSQVSGKIKDLLDQKASNIQVYEKLRSMKRRYQSLKNKMAQGSIKEDAFTYKSPHEKKLYKLWKQAWGEEEEEMEVHHNDAAGDEAETEEEVESDGGTETGKEPKVPSTEKAPVSNHILVKPPVSSRPIPNNKPEDSVHYETVIKETKDILAEVIREVKKMAETSEAKLKESLISQLRPNWRHR